LRGADFTGYEYGSLGPHTEADYEKMASWGFNIVRIPIVWSLIEPKPNQYNDSYLANTADRDLAWAQEYGIHVIIEMQQDCWSPRFTSCDAWDQAGVPLWATASYQDSDLGQAQARLDFWNGLGPNGTSVTASNPSMRDRFFAMWLHVAERYRSSTVVAGYDLFNEPYSLVYEQEYWPQIGGSSITTPWNFTETILVPFYTALIGSIRTVDPDHICFWEAPWQILPYPIGLPVSNIAYSPHYPGQFNFTTYDPSLVKYVMQFLVTKSKAWNAPVFIGEWGMRADADANNVTNYIRDFSDLLDKYLMSAAWYSYGRSTWPMSLQDQYGNDRTIFTQNLIRPHVAMASVVPSYSSFSVNMKQLQIGVPGPCTMSIYVQPFRTFAQVNFDSGFTSPYLLLQNPVIDISVPSGTNLVRIQFDP
jgi:endoglycosylceramidase